MPLTQSQQDIKLQKLVVLATGSAANSSQIAELNVMVSESGGFGSIDAVVDTYIEQLVATQGSIVTYQAIAKNGFGVTLSDAQAQEIITEFMAAGIDTGSKLLNLLSNVQNSNSITLDNRAEAASSFLATLEAAGKSADFTGQGVTAAVGTLLQNIGASETSLDNGKSGLNALSANISDGGIEGTLDSFLANATVFADTNRDGQLNAGEWTTQSNGVGTFVLPNDAVDGKIIAYGGVDLITGNVYQGVLSASTGTTVINPITTMIEALVAAGAAETVLDATTAVRDTLGLPDTINLLSYNPLVVLASNTATAAEKATALSVQSISHQISNIITHTASVIDNGTAGATLQSAGAAAALAIAQAIATAASAGASLDLSDATTIGSIIQASSTATGSTFTSTQIAQIAQVTAGSNATTASATTFSMQAQAFDVAQESATDALIAGAISGDFSGAVNGFTGTALTTANFNATIGSIAPGVLTLPTASEQAAAIALAAQIAAAAEAAAAEAPTATLTYSTDGGATSASTASVKDADTLRVIATFNKAVNDGTPTITIDNAILVSTAMTKIDSTHYFFDLNVPAGDIATATVTVGGAQAASGNVITAAPANAVFAVDNTAPTAPTSVALTAVGGTVVANTLNTSNTNLTATAAITAGEATGGSAVLKVGATTIATDASILAGDTSVTFNLGVASTAALQAAVAAGGIATVTVNDAAGNSAVSAVANPTLVVAYTAPSAPTGVALTSLGGTVVTNSLNSTNTNMTAVATITAGQATGGSAVLKIGATTIATDATILIADTTVTFDLSAANNAALQAAVAAGGVATVTVTDTAGNSSVSTLSNPTLAVDYLAAFIDLTTANDSLDGSASNDTFTGTYGNGAGPYTFNTGDILDGLGGIDTLNITTGAEASTPPDALWLSKTNFEKVIFNSLGNGAQVITTGAAFEAAFVTNGVDVTAQTLLGAIDINMTTFTGAATITTITTGSGAHTITTGSGVSTVKATGIAAGAQTVNGVGLTTVNATINGAGDQVIGTTNGGNLVTVNAAILAAGAQTIASTSSSDVTIVAAAASGAQTITTAGGNDSVTTTGAAIESATISTGAGNDVISAGLGSDTITGGTGADTMTGGGGVDSFFFGTNGSIVGTSMDIISDFNTAGADVLVFGPGVALPGIDATATAAGTNVQTSAGGLISFDALDNSLALKIIAIQADAELALLSNTAAMFVDGGNTYVYFNGALAGDSADDQLVQLTGIDTLTAITSGVSMTIV